jgi:uncharacterized protein
MSDLPLFIQALRDPACYPHSVDTVEILQTHISWVLLTGEFVYKIKKPVNFGFLDFSTLARRRFFCEEELRLNRQFSPQLYLGLSGLHGDKAAPRLDGSGELFEYAVKMRAFPQAQRLDQLLAAGLLTPSQMDELGADLASFHARARRVLLDVEAGIYAPMRDNFICLRELAPAEVATLDALQAWSEQQWQTEQARFAARAAAGFGRECHGDLHLQNIALFGQRLCLFDGIEFSPALREIDVISELAFLLMDLRAHGASTLAARLCNAYFEHSGDYEGAALLRFYQVYRALVRAKVAALSGAWETCRGYLAQAQKDSQPPRPFLLVVGGLSGSGKTTLSQVLLEQFGALRLRSDLERKRLFGLAPLTRAPAELYQAEASARTYARLAELSAAMLAAGHVVIVDAACLRRAQRDSLRATAMHAGVPFGLLWLQADSATLYARVAARARAGNDASDADAVVLTQQLAQQEIPADEEECLVVSETKDKEILFKQIRLFELSECQAVA